MAAIAGLTAVAAAGSGSWLHRRARVADTRVARLRSQLVAARYAADHDALTGLPNRRSFLHRAEALIGDPARQPLAVAVIDLDDFKKINDEWGHAAGDEVLITVAHRLAAWANDGLVGRFGGDEFAGLWTAPSVDVQTLRGAADMLAQTLALPMRIADHTVTVTASIGMAPMRPSDHLLETLRLADLAMYRTKTRRHTAYPAVVDGGIPHAPAPHPGRQAARRDGLRSDRYARPSTHR